MVSFYHQKVLARPPCCWILFSVPGENALIEMFIMALCVFIPPEAYINADVLSLLKLSPPSSQLFGMNITLL